MRRTLVVGSNGYFDGIAHLDESAGLLDMNVTRDGRAHMNWVMDADGMILDLTSQGVLPPTFLQTFRVFRRRERYHISTSKRAIAADLLRRIENLEDEYPETPNVLDLREYLGRMPPETVLDRATLKDYFGE